MLVVGGSIQPMGRLGVVVTLLSLAACGASQEHERQEKELAAAEKKLAEARAFQENLEQEKQALAKKLAEGEARRAELRTVWRSTLAGAAYLAEAGQGLTLDADMLAARQGFQLAEAARRTDGSALQELATQVLDDQRPCVAAPATDDPGGCGPCSVPAFEDACEGVEENLSSSPDWRCATVARTGKGVPAAAFCTSTLDHPAPGEGVASPYSEGNLPTSLQVVRIAFAEGGRLYVSDYPRPDPMLYNPPNVEPLIACKAETARNECVHDCEVRYDRYQNPCACTSDADAYEPDESEETEDEEEDVPPEVRQARQAAEAAEAEAEAAKKRAEEAQQEVEYQECLSACEPEKPSAHGSSEGDSEEAQVEPVSATVGVSLEATPAPGIFVVSRVARALGPRKEVVREEKHTVVLKYPELVALWHKEALSAEDPLGTLEQVGELDEVVSEGGKPSVAPLPGVEGPVLVGLRGGKVHAYAFHSQPGQEPVEDVAPATVCAAVRSDSKRFPEQYQKACADVTASAPARPALETPAPSGAGDAGASGGAAEVSP